ncbi:MAG: hypothetical protein FJ053_07815 [Cyanobacteria bacterium M_surface_10_m1_298]|nr:hypothetical protein [Cyanobacteria bacterium M_surface_10_m1_298]
MDSDTRVNGFEQEAEPDAAAPAAARFRDHFDSLLPSIQQEWPELARHTLEATRGSLDTVVELIARQTGSNSEAIKEQLMQLVALTGESAHQVADSLRPLEQTLENLVDELNASLRPRLEKPLRERPLMTLGMAAAVGLVVGWLLSSGRRSS